MCLCVQACTVRQALQALGQQSTTGAQALCQPSPSEATAQADSKLAQAVATAVEEVGHL